MPKQKGKLIQIYAVKCSQLVGCVHVVDSKAKENNYLTETLFHVLHR